MLSATALLSPFASMIAYASLNSLSAASVSPAFCSSTARLYMLSATALPSPFASMIAYASLNSLSAASVSPAFWSSTARSYLLSATAWLSPFASMIAYALSYSSFSRYSAILSCWKALSSVIIAFLKSSDPSRVYFDNGPSNSVSVSMICDSDSRSPEARYAISPSSFRSFWIRSPPKSLSKVFAGS